LQKRGEKSEADVPEKIASPWITSHDTKAVDSSQKIECVLKIRLPPNVKFGETFVVKAQLSNDDDPQSLSQNLHDGPTVWFYDKTQKFHALLDLKTHPMATALTKTIESRGVFQRKCYFEAFIDKRKRFYIYLNRVVKAKIGKDW